VGADGDVVRISTIDLPARLTLAPFSTTM
jgi:hypothetical protein